MWIKYVYSLKELLRHILDEVNYLIIESDGNNFNSNPPCPTT